MELEDQPTCGKGLAANSALPAALGELIASLAENLELHMKALDLSDPNSRLEHDAYLKLVTAYRRIADELRATATQMAGYRDLPMGRHNERAMADPAILQAFEKLVNLEQTLLTLLQKKVGEDRGFLARMGGTESG